MAMLTRQSNMLQPATKGKYAGRPYTHITFRDPGVFGGKRTADRGVKALLPEWFRRTYGRRIGLRQTAQGKVLSDDAVGQRLSKYNDIKQVIGFDYWNDEEFIRLFFMMSVFSADKEFEFRS
jgi:hypothetical protein